MLNRLTKQIINDGKIKVYSVGNKSLFGYEMYGEPINKLGQIEDIEDKLGFSYKELVQMLIDGIYEVGAVDSETMKPISQGIMHFYVYGIDLENRKLSVFHRIFDWEMDTDTRKEVLFSVLDLDKYKKKCLSGWALTKKELEK